jgi:hypothetical protein
MFSGAVHLKSLVKAFVQLPVLLYSITHDQAMYIVAMLSPGQRMRSSLSLWKV